MGQKRKDKTAMVAAAHSSSGLGVSAQTPVRVPHDYILSGEKFHPDPPYLLEDEDGYDDVYSLLDNKTIGPESVTLTTLTFVPAREGSRYDDAR